MTGLENLTPGQMAFLLHGVEEHQASLREVRDRNAARLGVIPLDVLRRRLAAVDPEVTESEKRLLDGNR